MGLCDISICTKRAGGSVGRWREKGGGIESSFWVRSKWWIGSLDLCQYIENATIKHMPWGFRKCVIYIIVICVDELENPGELIRELGGALIEASLEEKTTLAHQTPTR